MRKKIVMMAVMCIIVLNLYAQSLIGISYDKAKFAPAMRWSCPEIAKYQGLLLSLKSDDYKIWANNVKNNIELYSSPEQPSNKSLVTQAILTIENPLYKTENLLNHISTWIKSKKKDWAKSINIDLKEKSIVSTATIHVASHSNFIDLFKVSVSPSLVIKLVEDDKLIISFCTNSYENGVYDSRNRHIRSYNDKISDVFPFVSKSSHKITYAKAYVGTYLYFWNFISELHNELNTNFTKDPIMLNQLRYQYSQDSLRVKYGEPTKVITGQTTSPDIHKELRFYEDAQKIVFMGKTINFNDIISCEVVDDPTFIPGRTTTYGLGFSIFGIGIGGADSYTTPDRTIHSYVVNVKIDNMSTPLIYIATGQNEQKANETAAVFEYILRHQPNKSNTVTTQKKKTTRRTKR